MLYLFYAMIVLYMNFAWQAYYLIHLFPSFYKFHFFFIWPTCERHLQQFFSPVHLSVFNFTDRSMEVVHLNQIVGWNSNINFYFWINFIMYQLINRITTYFSYCAQNYIIIYTQCFQILFNKSVVYLINPTSIQNPDHPTGSLVTVMIILF
jgi:hypothetical protein